MVDVIGEIEKLAPLFDVPIDVPPVGTVYHLIVLPVEVALRLVEEPHVIDEGEAVTFVGASGIITFTRKAVRVSLEQPIAFHEIIICPLPVRTPAVVVPELTPPI